jgi:hypothetical protein
MDSAYREGTRPDPEYRKPQIRDYGDLRQLTAAHVAGHITDVPRGAPLPNIFS